MTIVEEVSNSNRDPHLLFNQVGLKAGLIAEAIVKSAFIALWIDGNEKETNRVAEFAEA